MAKGPVDPAIPALESPRAAISTRPRRRLEEAIAEAMDSTGSQDPFCTLVP